MLPLVLLALLLPLALLGEGESGAMTFCGRGVSLTGASKPPLDVELRFELTLELALELTLEPRLRFMAASKAVGRSFAPGGIVRLLGLPSGVLSGLMKLLMFMVGVTGRGSACASPARGALSLPELLLVPTLELPGKKVDMKLAIFFFFPLLSLFNPLQGVTWRQRWRVDWLDWTGPGESKRAGSIDWLVGERLQ